MDDDIEDDDIEADTAEYDVAESLSSFRRAGSKVSEGIEHLYHGGKERAADQHVIVQVAITVSLWFAGNWVYNRISTLLVDSAARVLSTVPTESILPLILDFLSGDVALSTARLLGISTGALLGQNRLQTRKLKDIKSKLTTVSESQQAATDGGSPRSETTVHAGIGGALAGASIGLSFGPGGVLAGIYLGYVVEERLMRRELSDGRVERE